MISCEDFEKYLLDLHKGQIDGELREALEEHRRLCRTCSELTPALIQIRERLMSLVALEPRPGFETRLARRLQESERAPKRFVRSLEESLVANWLAFGAGAVATVLIGFLIFSYHPGGPISTGPQTATNQIAPVETPSQSAINPGLLTEGRENLPLGKLNDSTGQFMLTAKEDSVPVDRLPSHEWQGYPVSQTTK
jgi:hypothetical protein